MIVATWNINGVRSRLDAVLAWLALRGVDVLCLQEVKSTAEEFPFAAFQRLGFAVALHPQRSYNGVAIVSRRPITDVVLGLGDSNDDPEARLISATISGVRVLSVYVPHGQRVGEETFAHKLAWLKRLRANLDLHYRPETPLVACGDFNVAPEARDVFSPTLWRDKVHFHVDARVALKDVLAFGLVDTFRLHHAGDNHFTWFDYQGRDTFERNLGLRIDHIFATRPMAERCVLSAIDRAPRALPHASDHVPMMSAFAEIAP